MIRRLWRRLAKWWDAPDVSDRWLREMRRQQYKDQPAQAPPRWWQ